MLDEKANPQLLEVNLSPACSERTPWLADMLDRMSDELFGLLERKLSKISDDFSDELKTYLREKKPLSSWQLIYN